MSTSPMDATPAQTVAQAQAEVDRLHRSGSMTLIALAAFWGIAAALFQWGSPLAGEIALVIGSLAAHPVAWLILKLAGGPAMVPRSNALAPLFYQVTGIPVIAALGAMALAQTRPDAFFAASMLGLAAAALPTASLYGRKLYLVFAAVFLILPVIAWVGAQPILPWFGVIGIALLIMAGALLLRRLGGLGAAPHPATSLHDDAPEAPSAASSSGAVASGASASTGVGGSSGAAPFDAEASAPAGEASWDQAAETNGPFGTQGNAASSGMEDLDDAVITDHDLNKRPEA